MDITWHLSSNGRYEGQRILILESVDDDLIGFQDEHGQRLMEVNAANRTIIVSSNLLIP